MTDTGWERTGHDWTPEDVEAVAQATLNDSIADSEILFRLGPFPPDDYLEALGNRILELSDGQRAADIDIKARE